MTNIELNEAISDGSIGELIQVAEARQRKTLSKVADDICAHPGVRLVLVSGGSAAGKTTTAKRLCTQLRVNDRFALHISTDDYFVGDDRTPRAENGELDYEHVECVDIARLVADINALCQGEAVPVRRFDFATHVPYVTAELRTLPADGIVVLEGIHALNPRLTAAVADNCKFRLFIDPVSQPIVFAFTRLSATDARLLRRLVRDNQFRKMDPMTTFSMWPKVLAGEEKWIKPFRPLADAEFDSALAYEPAVLKPFAQGLLARVRLRGIDDPKVEFLMEFLESVHPTDPTKVPGDSILRETIGGSQLEY